MRRTVRQCDHPANVSCKCSWQNPAQGAGQARALRARANQKRPAIGQNWSATRVKAGCFRFLTFCDRTGRSCCAEISGQYQARSYGEPNDEPAPVFSPRVQSPVLIPAFFAESGNGRNRRYRCLDQADREAGDHALQVGASGRGEVRAPAA